MDPHAAPGRRTLTADTLAGLCDGPVGAYLHVPFCARICPFCPYNKVIPRLGQPERYFTALLAEARRLTAAAGFRRLAVIAAVGTRAYYTARGFERGENYLVMDV